MHAKNRKILVLVEETYEELELHYPKLRMMEAGAHVTVAGAEKDKIYKGKYGYPCKADVAFEEVDPKAFDALIIPGGYAPDKLRKIPAVLNITRAMHKENKWIAFICHAGWVPISAQVLKGVRCTSYEAIKDDMINAGANWVDEPVVIDGHFISSRFPGDLPQFCEAIVQNL